MSQAATTQQQKQAAKETQKPKAKKHRMRGDLYDLSGAVAKLKNRKCPRCGSVMAFHGGTAQRWVCGSGSFTDYGQKKTRALRSAVSFYLTLTANRPGTFIPLNRATSELAGSITTTNPVQSSLKMVCLQLGQTGPALIMRQVLHALSVSFSSPPFQPLRA